jgi:ABC-type protease/lipase transport system fused ATPase/permease subunit
MLQVYDRVLPSRNVSTLLALSTLVLAAYALQGCLDAIRSRMLTRISALLDASLQEPIYAALMRLSLKGAAPVTAQQPLRDLELVRAFLSGMGPTAFLDMPWLPIFLLVLFSSIPSLGPLPSSAPVSLFQPLFWPNANPGCSLVASPSAAWNVRGLRMKSGTMRR